MPAGASVCGGGGEDPDQAPWEPQFKGRWWRVIDKLYKEKQHGWFGVVSLLRNIVVLPFLTQWMSEIVDSTKPYMLYVFFYTYKFMTI